MEENLENQGWIRTGEGTVAVVKEQSFPIDALLDHNVSIEQPLVLE